VKNKSRAPFDAKAIGKAPETCTLTLRMMVCSTEAVLVGDELEITGAGDHRPHRWMKYNGLAKLRLDSSYPDDKHSQALLLDYSMEIGMACTIG
jgi:hypothetical protein